MAQIGIKQALFKFPELIFKDEFNFTFDMIPIRLKNIPIKKKINLFKQGIDLLFKRIKMFSLPSILQIEPSNICNLKCHLCPTAKGDILRNKGFMQLDVFDKIMAALADVLFAVYLYGWGEPFLNKDIIEMIKICNEKNIKTLTSTNGHLIDSIDKAMYIVDSGLDILIIAIDGSNQEIYGFYRSSGEVKKVISAVEFIEKAKAIRKTQLPYTNLRVVVNSYNITDISNIEKLAIDLGVNMFSCKSLGCLPYDDNFDNYETSVPGMSRYKAENSMVHKKKYKCYFPFRQPSVFIDGTVVGCEFDYNSQFPFGKIGEKHFEKLWNSQNSLKMREAIFNKNNMFGFCKLCPYEKRVVDSSILFHKELQPLR